MGTEGGTPDYVEMFRYSEKDTKFEKKNPIILDIICDTKTGRFFQILVAFSELLNFMLGNQPRKVQQGTSQ
jgi:hypothetical protein